LEADNADSISTKHRSWLLRGSFVLFGVIGVWYWQSDLTEIFPLMGDRELISETLQRTARLV
jgi:hypothetical protein